MNSKLNFTIEEQVIYYPNIGDFLISDNRNPDIQNRFFEMFTGPWEFFMRQGRYGAAQELWRKVLQTASSWENVNQIKLHKGTPYYLWATSCILAGNLENGFLLMHLAFEEDRCNYPDEWRKKPANAFISLDSRNERQLLYPVVNQVASLVEKYLDKYNETTGGKFEMCKLRSAVLECETKSELAFLFVYLMSWLHSYRTATAKFDKDSKFRDVLLYRRVFEFCLLFEVSLKYTLQGPGKSKLYSLLKNLSQKLELNMHKNCGINQSTLLDKVNRDSHKDMAEVIDLLLARKYLNQSIPKLSQIEYDIMLTYIVRNSSGHNIESLKIDSNRIDAVIERILNAFFFSVQKIHLTGMKI